jgi:hypothetical protein
MNICCNTTRRQNQEGLDLDLQPEDGGVKILVNIQPQHYTASEPRRPRLESSSWRWRQQGPTKHPTTTLHGVTKQKTSTWILRSSKYSVELRDGWWGGSSPGRGWEFFSSPPRSDRLWGPPSLLSKGHQWVFPWGVKRRKHEADHSPPSSAEVKNAWKYTSTPQYAFMAWCSVKKSRGTT